MLDQKFSTINIREYLNQNDNSKIGEDILKRLISDFFCPINLDVEHFYKEENKFKQFDVRETTDRENNSHMLIQMLKLL